MRSPAILLVCTCIQLLDIGQIIASRSVHRPEDPYMPKITARWLGGSKTYSLKDSHLEERPIFKIFNKKEFNLYMLPPKNINYRYHPKKSVSGKKLGKLAQHVLHEVLVEKKKWKYTHFVALKNRDFSARDNSGLLIFKYKDYPFILKLFIETPQGFVRPYAKGFEPTCFFVMGSAMRHLTGFTRIKNLEAIKKKIKPDPYWSSIVTWPKKWFWVPPNNKWFEVVGENIGPTGKSRIEFPSVYGVICDAIDSEGELSLLNRKSRLMGMALSRFLNYRIDPHLKNFLVEKGSKKLAIVDTEHFPTLVGLKREMRSQTYSAWYLKLAGKFISDKLFRNKKVRRNLQLFPTEPYIL